MKNSLIHISFSKIDFKCPNCDKKYNDGYDDFYKRIQKNKNGYTTHMCTCAKRFGITNNFKGDMIGFKLDS
jgi:hypothetical protein